jgi:hypothetical protein
MNNLARKVEIRSFLLEYFRNTQEDLEIQTKDTTVTVPRSVLQDTFEQLLSSYDAHKGSPKYEIRGYGTAEGFSVKVHFPSEENFRKLCEDVEGSPKEWLTKEQRKDYDLTVFKKGCKYGVATFEYIENGDAAFEMKRAEVEGAI